MFNTEIVRATDVNGTPFTYRLCRSRRRSLSISIDGQGVLVRVPQRLALYEIETALRERAQWIFHSLDWWQRHHRDLADPGWCDGATIFYRGNPLALCVRMARREKITHDLLGLSIMMAHASEAAVAYAVHRWWWREAERILFPQVYLEAAKLDRHPAKVALSDARTQWGSCNARGVIRINWRLILLPPQLAVDVIAHEVAHLCELNHSRRFWTLVEKLRPDIRQRNTQLAEWSGLLAS
ncbi:MAG: M48 family metallopeptidase [Burkholderiales bacterium]|jgi:predicted metal-dependent hydrolase|nr:M48 family metallopeptidase [Burkholderiales bacterium]